MHDGLAGENALLMKHPRNCASGKEQPPASPRPRLSADVRRRLPARPHDPLPADVRARDDSGIDSRGT